jgi:hypothetical protein
MKYTKEVINKICEVTGNEASAFDRGLPGNRQAFQWSMEEYSLFKEWLLERLEKPEFASEFFSPTALKKVNKNEQLLFILSVYGLKIKAKK